MCVCVCLRACVRVCVCKGNVLGIRAWSMHMYAPISVCTHTHTQTFARTHIHTCNIHAQVATGISYLLLGCAWNIPLLFASQLPTVLMQSMHCSQVLNTHIFVKKHRYICLKHTLDVCASAPHSTHAEHALLTGIKHTHICEKA